MDNYAMEPYAENYDNMGMYARSMDMPSDGMGMYPRGGMGMYARGMDKYADEPVEDESWLDDIRERALAMAAAQARAAAKAKMGRPFSGKPVSQPTGPVTFFKSGQAGHPGEARHVLMTLWNYIRLNTTGSFTNVGFFRSMFDNPATKDAMLRAYPKGLFLFGQDVLRMSKDSANFLRLFNEIILLALTPNSGRSPMDIMVKGKVNELFMFLTRGLHFSPTEVKAVIQAFDKYIQKVKPLNPNENRFWGPFINDLLYHLGKFS